MSKFFILGTYSPESYEGFIKNPEQDRKALAQALAKAMGAKITGMDFLRGSYDFIATIEAENFEDLAAVKLTFATKKPSFSSGGRICWPRSKPIHPRTQEKISPFRGTPHLSLLGPFYVCLFVCLIPLTITLV